MGVKINVTLSIIMIFWALIIWHVEMLGVKVVSFWAVTQFILGVKICLGVKETGALKTRYQSLGD